MARPRKHQPGSRNSQLWYTAEQHELVKAAAKLDGRSMANFAMHATLRAARVVMAAEKAAAGVHADDAQAGGDTEGHG